MFDSETVNIPIPLPQEGIFVGYGKTTDTVTFIFDDEIVLKHYYFKDTNFLPYDSPLGLYIFPTEHNIWKFSSWHPAGEQSYTYTITEEDYQRALEQSGK